MKTIPKTVFITQSNYIPWKGYFDAINSVDEFIIFDEMQFTRRDWRNRNKIVTPVGLQWLTVPVEVKGKYYQTINETRVSDPRWGIKHWNAIRANYARAPHFERLSGLLESLYLESDEVLLSRINQNFIAAINKYLGIDTVISRCEEYGVVEGKNERLIDLCIKAGASEYLTGRAAQHYLDVELFAEAKIKVKWIDYSDYPVYHQLGGNFDHKVSILDLLLNTGAQASFYMKSFKGSL